MNRRNRQDEPATDPNERAPDPAFDLRQGLKVLVLVITAMVVLTIVCVTLARY